MTTVDTAGLYAYAFLDAAIELPDDVPGVDRSAAPVRLISRDGLALLVSEVDTARLRGMLDTDLCADSELASWAREHDRVVRAAFARGAVLPFRFGTVLHDRGAAERLLAERYDVALAMLAHVRDRVEWGVRVRRRPDAASDNAQPANRTSGAAYLADRRKRLRDLEERRAHGRDVAAAIRDDLAVSVADVADRANRSSLAGSDALVDVALLVDRAAEEEFLARAAEHATRAADIGLAVDVTGPWPPYSFVHTAWEVADAR